MNINVGIGTCSLLEAAKIFDNCVFVLQEGLSSLFKTSRKLNDGHKNWRILVTKVTLEFLTRLFYVLFCGPFTGNEVFAFDDSLVFGFLQIATLTVLLTSREQACHIGRITSLLFQKRTRRVSCCICSFELFTSAECLQHF